MLRKSPVAVDPDTAVTNAVVDELAGADTATGDRDVLVALAHRVVVHVTSHDILIGRDAERRAPRSVEAVGAEAFVDLALIGHALDERGIDLGQTYRRVHDGPVEADVLLAAVLVGLDARTVFAEAFDGFAEILFAGRLDGLGGAGLEENTSAHVKLLSLFRPLVFSRGCFSHPIGPLVR